MPSQVAYVHNSSEVAFSYMSYNRNVISVQNFVFTTIEHQFLVCSLHSSVIADSNLSHCWGFLFM